MLCDFECKSCGYTEERYFRKRSDVPEQAVCAMCEGIAVKLFPRSVQFNVYNETYEPSQHNRFNLNPEKLMSDKPGGGADYAKKYHEERTGQSRMDTPGYDADKALAGTIEGKKRWKASGRKK